MPAPRDHALSIWNAAVDAVRPAALVRRIVQVADGKLTIGQHQWDLSRFDRLIVIGGGKAATTMTEGLVGQLKSELPVTRLDQRSRRNTATNRWHHRPSRPPSRRE